MAVRCCWPPIVATDVRGVLFEPNLRQQSSRPLVSIALWHSPHQPWAESDVAIKHSQVRKQIELLEDHADFARCLRVRTVPVNQTSP